MSRFFNMIMSQEFLKWLAIISMVADHISEHLLDGYQPGRAMGRLAFPLFAMLVAYNYAHYYQGRFPNKYLYRLLFFGLLTQAAYVAFGVERLNIMVTLSLGLLTMYLYYNRDYFWLITLCTAVALFNHFVFSIEYGLPGVSLLLFLSLKHKYQVVFPALFLTARPPMPFQDNPVIAVILPTAFYSEAHTLLFETCFVLSIAFATIAYMYMAPTPGRSKHKYFFYAFYPAHLSIILGLQWFLSK